MLLNHYDQSILVGINREGVHLVDQGDHVLILNIFGIFGIQLFNLTNLLFVERYIEFKVQRFFVGLRLPI